MLGAEGIAAFDEICGYARRAGLVVIADGKRGDIGSTARAYSAAYLEGDEPRADALTVNPWLGRESVEPYLAAARRYGPGSSASSRPRMPARDMQDVTLSNGTLMWHHVAKAVASGARISSASTDSPRSAPSSVRPTHAPWARRAS